MASARQIRDEIMKMTIVVNSDPAQKAVYELSKKNDELREAERKLKEEMKEVSKESGKQTDAYKELQAEAKKTKDKMQEVSKEAGKQSEEYKELEKQAKKLKEEMKAVAQESGKQSEKYKELEKEAKKARDEIRKNTDEMERLRGEMDISQMTIAQLKKEAALLRAQLANMVPGSEAHKALQDQLQAVNDRIHGVNTGAQESKLSFAELSDKFNRYSGIVAAGAAVLVGFGVSIQQVIDRNNKLADAMSGVEKTTGMTKNEVEDLARTFLDFNTRTSKVDLLKIAEVGGRLGVAKSEIKDFTQEVDKAYVALGDSWEGGVDKLADSMGRIAGLYSETKSQPIAKSINEIGSALNELAAQGASSEQNIADFVTRMGRVPGAMRPPLNTLLGFGSAFEEMGVNSEIASSGFSKFIRVAANDVGGFAQVMNQPIEKIRELINSNPAEFFLQFSQGLKGLDADQVARVLDKLKLSDNEVQGAIGAATENADRFRESMDLANKSVQEGTSLQLEFNKVNNNAAALWQKIQKRMAEIFTSGHLSEFLISAIDLFGKFIGVTEEGNTAFQFYRNTLFTLVKILSVAAVSYISLTAAVTLYNAVVKKSTEETIALTIVEKARNVVTTVSNALTTLYTATLALLGWAYAKVAKDTARATFAMNTFKIAMATNPIGAIVALVSLLATAYFTLSQAFSDNTKEVKDNAKQLDLAGQTMKKVSDEQAKSVGEFQSKVGPLIALLKDEKSSLDDRKKAYQELIKISPEFQGTLDSEYRATARLGSVYDMLIGKIKKAAEIRALQASLDEMYTKRQKQMDVKAPAEEAINEQKPKNKYDYNRNPNTAGFKLMQNITTDANKNIEELDKNIDNVSKKIVALSQGDQSKYNIPEEKEPKVKKPKKDPKPKSEDPYNNMITEWTKKSEDAKQKAVEIQNDIEDARIQAMQDGYTKEIAEIELQEKRKEAAIDKQMYSVADFKLLDSKLAKAKGNDKKLFEGLKKSWEENNKRLEEEKAHISGIYQLKKQEAEHKYFAAGSKRDEENFKKQIDQLNVQKSEKIATLQSVEEQKQFLRENGYKGEIDNIRKWEEGKAAIENFYQQKSLEKNLKFLQDKVKEWEALKQLDVPLDPEQLKTLEEYRAKIAELVAQITTLKHGTEDKQSSLKIEGGNTDILGLTPKQWQEMFKNTDDLATNLGKVSAAIKVMQNMQQAYFAYVDANQKKELQHYESNAAKRKTRLKQELDAGIINQDTYKRETLKTERELEKQKSILAVKAAKRERMAQISSIIGNTAAGIMQLWVNPGFPAAIPMAVAVGAMGALQIGTVLAQPLPVAEGYEFGYNMVPDEYEMQRAQDGKKFTVRQRRLASGLVKKPTHFIAGENGVEMVIDSPTWAGYPQELKNAIYSANSRRASGFEAGYNKLPNGTEATSANSDEIMLLVISALKENTATMRNVQKYGIQAKIEKSARNGKEFHEMTQEYLDLDNKNTH